MIYNHCGEEGCDSGEEEKKEETVAPVEETKEEGDKPECGTCGTRGGCN
ncbi:hypothetical protein KKA27_03835 [Patescibacteria group bacterium]|nr:hypothetical protein [Patescibacteria group bacterium]